MHTQQFHGVEAEILPHSSTPPAASKYFVDEDLLTANTAQEQALGNTIFSLSF